MHAGSGTVDAGTVAAELAIGLFNTLRNEADPVFRSIPSVLYQVELTSRVTVVAQGSDQVKSVRFKLDNQPEVLDTSKPFRLNENAQGQAQPWAVKPGMHLLEVTGFQSIDGTGTPIAKKTVSFELSTLGLAPNFTPVSDAANSAWGNANLPGAMTLREMPDGTKRLRYRIFVPPDYNARVKYPLVVYLHGRGERGTTDNDFIVRTKLFPGPRSLISPNGRYPFPAIVIAPQCIDEREQGVDQEWAKWDGNLGADGNYVPSAVASPSATRVMKLIDELKKQYTIDASRIYLTGISMGGFGTWEFTTRWPDTWSAAIPMADFSPRQLASKVKNIPFWVFHHVRDEYNPVAGSRNMSKAVNDAGGSAKYTEYTYVYMGGGNPPGCFYHCGSFDKAYTDEAELLPWLFAQRKSP